MLPFRLGSWHVHPDANEIRAGDRTVRLEPKAMGVLVALASRAGEAVRRDEIEAAVWPDVVVTEASLTRCVSHLREALGDDARAPSLIETVPTVGYRLLVPPAPLPGTALPADARLRGRWIAASVALVALVAIAWRLGPGRPPPAVVTYRIEATGQPGTLAVRYTGPDGDTTESLRDFPAERTVSVDARHDRRYEVQVAGRARRATVELSVRARRGADVLAQGWALGQVDKPAPESLHVQAHVDIGPARR